MSRRDVSSAFPALESQLRCWERPPANLGDAPCTSPGCCCLGNTPVPTKFTPYPARACGVQQDAPRDFQHQRIMLEGRSCSTQSFRHCSGRQGGDGMRVVQHWTSSPGNGCRPKAARAQGMCGQCSQAWGGRSMDLDDPCGSLPAASRCFQLPGQSDPSLSLERCPFIPKSSHFASQGISLDGGGGKMRILDSGLGYQLITVLLQVRNAGLFLLWEKQDHSSLTPILWESQPWEQGGRAAGAVWKLKRMDKDPAASIPSPALLLAPVPTAQPEWMEQNAQAGTRSCRDTGELLLLHPLGWAALGLGLGFSAALLHRFGLQHPKVICH
ncbi:uncharacterized protein LOC111926377 [Cyanistes caeruleus]|uniref:uncharacterized protein LOC111926377 n=1 Tax=Cyanistes caeruleus TaxID=156563 RepID=UPI000CDA99AD|nr:uncharacterized protein LOC111926377 [Cyanistes caeruleus]